MHEHVGLVRGGAQRVARRRVAREDDAPAAPLGAHDLLGRDAVDDLAALQAPEGGPGGHAQPRREPGVEAPGPGLLDERPAEGRPAVAGGEGLHRVAVEGDVVAGLDLGDRELVAETAGEPPDDREQVARAGRPEEVQRGGAVAQVEGLEHPRQAEPVVEVEVRQEDRGDLRQPHGAQELALRPLAAVEEQLVAAAPHEERREAAPGGRHGARGAGEEEREVHPVRRVADGRLQAQAPVAQWIERSPPEREVAGSNPAGRARVKELPCPGRRASDVVHRDGARRGPRSPHRGPARAPPQHDHADVVVDAPERGWIPASSDGGDAQRGRPPSVEGDLIRRLRELRSALAEESWISADRVLWTGWFAVGHDADGHGRVLSLQLVPRAR